jgi:Tfp pilus assembly protein PilV
MSADRCGRRGSIGARRGVSTAAGLGVDGFTVVEALAAIGLLSIVLLGTAVGADRATRYTEYSRTAATAMTLVQDESEQLMAAAVGSATLTAGNHTDANNPITSIAAAGGTYTRTWTVSSNTPANGLLTINVQVAWNLYGSNYSVNQVMVRCSIVGC